jgi:hypothetical protein
MSDPLRQARIDLAAALRWSARIRYQQGVCNHFSLLSPLDSAQFLVNPEGLFWSEVTASSLLLCDLDGKVLEGNGTVESSALACSSMARSPTTTSSGCSIGRNRNMRADPGFVRSRLIPDPAPARLPI